MRNVLIVEDDCLIADLLEDQLEADGFNVVGVARTAEGAVELAKGHDLDFAVIDLQLAGGDRGTDAAARLRGLKGIRILFSTGNDDAALTTGLGDAVMKKPYRMKDVGPALRIIGEIARLGQTGLPFPRNFRLLSPELA